MQKLIKTLSKASILYFAIAVTLSIAYLSLIKMSSVSVGIKVSDKILHGVAYFVLATSWLFSFYRKPHLTYVIILLCVIYGIIIEVLQASLTDYRTGDYLDVLANTCGVILGFVMFRLVLIKNQSNNN